MGILGMILYHAGELYPPMKLKMAIRNAEKKVPAETRWRFCQSLLPKVSRSFALVIQQLKSSRDPQCGGTRSFKVLMDQFHFVRTAFLELNKSYQEVIVNRTERMASGLVKYLHKEVETIDDYNEYCHRVSGLVGLGLSKLFYISGLENLAPEFLSNSMELFLQKITIIRDYLEDVNESRYFSPRQIWRKYANKLEDFKYKDNSVKTIQCLNDMVTDALVQTEDCLKYLSAVRDLSILRFCAIPQVDKNDPDATSTINRLEDIQKICKNSSAIFKRKSYVIKNGLLFDATQVLVLLFFITLAMVFAYLSASRAYQYRVMLQRGYTNY